jgi:hypothetical protein
MSFPSTFADIQSDVLTRIRMDSNNATDVQMVKDWINQVYAEVCVMTEANITSATMALTAGTKSYTLPSGVVRIKEMFVTPVGSVATSPVEQTNLDEILRLRAGNSGVAVSNGTVNRYALLGLNQFEVYPTPGNADVITIYYVALPTALSAGTDVPILGEPFNSQILGDGAAALAADFKSDPQQQTYEQMYGMGLSKFRTHLIRRQGGQTQQLKMYPSRPYVPHDPSTDIGY